MVEVGDDRLHEEDVGEVLAEGQDNQTLVVEWNVYVAWNHWVNM